MDGLSAADVALLNNDGVGGGVGGMIWLFAIIALMGGGFGGGWGGNQGNTNAIQADVNRGFDNQNLQAQTRDILSAVTNGTAQSIATANQVYHDVVGYVGDKYTELQRECCCSILRGIDGVNYNAAMNTAAINANITAVGQKITDLIMGNRMDDMQNRINQLELQTQLQGVMRYPQGWTYNAGTNPFCGGCNNM